MKNIFLVLLVWIVAIIGIKVMKKLQPEDILYPFYAVAICILLTLLVGYCESWHLILLSFLKH